MKNQMVENDIYVFCETATSFPEGVLAAFEKLHEYFSFSSPRNFYGLSRCEKDGEIVYIAAAEMKGPEEASKYDLGTNVIPKGNYVGEVVHDFMQNIPGTKAAFERLMKHPGIDKHGYCVEWYSPNDKDVLCMIRLA